MVSPARRAGTLAAGVAIRGVCWWSGAAGGGRRRLGRAGGDRTRFSGARDRSCVAPRSGNRRDRRKRSRTASRFAAFARRAARLRAGASAGAGRTFAERGRHRGRGPRRPGARRPPDPAAFLRRSPELVHPRSPEVGHPTKPIRLQRGLGPRSPNGGEGAGFRFGGSIHGAGSGAPENDRCPVRTLLLPGGGPSTSPSASRTGGCPFGRRVQPVGVRRVSPSIRRVWQRWRSRSSSALTMGFWPRNSYHCS